MTVKPVFGNLGAFVNGNMFMGLFGSDVGVKLGDADHEALRQAGGPCITTYITVHLKSGDEIYLVLRAQYS